MGRGSIERELRALKSMLAKAMCEMTCRRPIPRVCGLRHRPATASPDAGGKPRFKTLCATTDEWACTV